jgi:methyltransferase
VVTAADMGRALVVAVTLERAVELLVSRRNARRLLAAGAVEAGRGHYPAMVGFHAALLAACVVEPALRPAPWPFAFAAPAALLVLLAQGLRWWAVSALGGRWSTKVIVLPGAAPVRSGPYRWLRHPNYLAVIVEVAALPLAAGAWRTAVVATVLNAGILAVRIRAEEGAMGKGWEAAFEGIGRFVPGPAAIPGSASESASASASASESASESDSAAAADLGAAPASATAYGGGRPA